MRLMGLVVVGAIACRPQPAERLANVEPRGHVDEQPVFARPFQAAAARPELDFSGVIPEPTEQARWPLSAAAHPALEPRFAIASALAEPGIDWTELCRMGAQNRHLSGDRDLGAYLKAWCHAASGDPAAAFAELAVMSNPVVPGMAPAIRTDLADLLVQNGDADHAEHLLAAAKVEDLAIFDLLAASYFEVGKFADAAEINERAIDRQGRSSDAAKCHRFARRVILKSPTERPLYMRELDALGDELSRGQKKLSTDPECKQLDEEVGCWSAPDLFCKSYLATKGSDAERYQELFDAYFRWPLASGSWGEWMAIATHAAGAMPLPGADRLEGTALRTAFSVAQCTNQDGIRRLRALATELRDESGHDHAIDHVLDALVANTTAMLQSPSTCQANRWTLQ